MRLTGPRWKTSMQNHWPVLPWSAWRDTAMTLHLWIQIVGKVRLALSPWLNHGWQVPLYVTACGLGTSAIPFGSDILDIEFDFISHLLVFRSSLGILRSMPLLPQTVADFYAIVLDVLESMGVSVAIHDMPNEVLDPIPFPLDRVHDSYDPAAVSAFWRVLVQADRVFKLFRTGFLGKASP